jgi:hypothetical protein
MKTRINAKEARTKTPKTSVSVSENSDRLMSFSATYMNTYM